MSITLKKINVETFLFSKERQNEALHQQSMFRLDPLIISEGETFDWNNLISKPELLELRVQSEYKGFSTDINSDEQEWPFAQNSYFYFNADNVFRIGLAKTIQSDKFIKFMRFVTILNVVAVCFYDYTTRLYGDTGSDRNRIFITLEIFCNIIFGFEVIAQTIVQGFVFEKNSYLRSWWNIINFSTFIATWAVLGDINSNNQFIHILRIIRLLRALRLVQDSRLLKTQMDAFIGSFPRLGPILIPLLFVLLFYTIVGLHLFMGVTEYRCRYTPEPEDGEWEIVESIQKLCGVWQCPKGTYCGSNADYGLPQDLKANAFEPFGYGFDRFDDFFHSLLVTFTFLNVTGWSGTTFLFWKAMTTYATAFYFISLIFILAFVLSNLLLATFYESFMVNSSIKSNQKLANKEKENIEAEIMKKKQQQMMTRLAALNEVKVTRKNNKRKFQVSLTYPEEEAAKNQFIEQFEKIQIFSSIMAKSEIFMYMNLSVILICCIGIAYDYDGISRSTVDQLLIMDFFCIMYFFFELLIMLWGIGNAYFNEIINILDTLVIATQLILIIVLFFWGEPIIINYSLYVNFVKAFKILRLMKFLYVARLFYTISVLARCLIETIIKIRDMVLLFVIIVLIVALFGQELIAYKVMFTVTAEGEYEVAEHEHKLSGVSLQTNYEGFGNSYMAALNIFYNEEWHMTMFNYAQKLYVSLIYYIIGVLMGQVLFVRLLTAVFLNDFCKQLNKIELDLKPIDITFYYRKIVNFVAAFWRRRQRTKIHHQSGVSIRSPRSTVIDKFNKVRPSIFHPGIATPSNANTQPKEAPQDEARFTTPSNILSNKESMMINRPLQRGDDSQRDLGAFSKQVKEACNEEEIVNDHEEVEDEEEEEEEIKSPDPNPIRKKPHMRVNEKTLFIFSPDSDFRRLVTTLVNKNYFRAFNFTLILLTCIRIALLSPTEDPDSDLSYVLKVGYIFLTVFYILVILLNCIAFGLYKTEQSYFRSSIFNIFTFAITIVDLITLIFDITNPFSKFITSLRILQFIQIGAVFNKNIGYAQTSLLNAFAKMFQLAVFCMLILAMYGILAVKLLKGQEHECSGMDATLYSEVTHDIDCMDLGGSWVNARLNFDSIFQAILTLFIVCTTENWLPLLYAAENAVGKSVQPITSYNRYWGIYFYVFFFIGNLCMLNMFIGLIVNAYQEAKMVAQDLHLLDETQREWFSIKLNIFKLRPLVKSKWPTNKIRRILFFMVKNKHMKILWLCIILANSLVLTLYYHRQNEQYHNVLDILNEIFVVIFAIEIISRFFAKDLKMYLKDTPNVIDIFGIWICVVNLFLRNDQEIDYYFRRIFNAVSVGFQLIRNYRIVKRFNEIEKLFSSIFSIIPSALSMMFIMLIFLFIYTTLGMDLFAFLRPQKTITDFDLHFRKFTTAMFTLVKVASSEYWYPILEDCLHMQEPDFACHYMSGYDDYVKYGYNGCGTYYAYLFFISFHLIFSLMILNLFIASILGAYEEHVKSEESAISKYQLNDVLTLWRNYDPEGRGFINYKDFWRLSSEIAIIFGVDQADLLDVNNKKNFLKVLNIPIYEAKSSNVLCYKFHDVILSLTKISVTLKYGVTQLEPSDKVIQQKLQAQIGEVQNYNIDQFNPTSFNSGDMVSIITIQKQVRFWKRRVQIRKQGGDPSAMFNEMSDFKNMIKKQIELEAKQAELEGKPV